MKLVSFNFTKIDAEKLSDNLKDLKISTGIDISDIKTIKSDFFRLKGELIAVGFNYTVAYEANIAKLDFKGNIVLSVEPKLAKEVLKQWQDKKIPEEFKLTVFNIILKKSSLKAIQFEEEFNLPLHIPLPTIKPPEKK
ncbi:MAG: hypothetical protein ABIE36_01850 [Candidatus Diapherotrites archaeon]